MPFVPFIDPLYIIFLLPGLLVTIVAMFLLRIWTDENRRRINSQGLSGADVLQKIAQAKGFPISMAITDQELGDNYNPLNKTVTLSMAVANERSITSVGIAAHELGHVEQHISGSALMAIRTTIAPVVSIGSNLGMILLMAGIVIGISQLAWIGVLFFAGTTLFTLITLPIELDASRRAMRMITELRLLDATELGGVRKVLIAAALTYVAAVLQSLGQLAYFAMQASGVRRND
ncbi:MAG: zinc metallopeptidase [Candidatus Dojkabacteria bacterium]|uniref:Zinc metallopeptidase n=2 Tax=Candidatus Dojkabacteria TaxID=74243 RepID=A0A952AKA5_9BACT|nr:MAG: putative neutral zinc metallopeptidase [candidate division WS6 bacterium OLB21]MBW7953620.1 zinc metallopeptidase [Candidatus Dojkabacteria bacterium]WKZ27893.1 MAG: zinc metallopeptidase [Candidatus Dojkabacteria bacterium]